MSVADYEAMLGRVDSGEMSANPQNISVNKFDVKILLIDVVRSHSFINLEPKCL